jgi:hypothetical protein
MHRESTFHADAERELSHREGTLWSAAFLLQDDSLEDLRAPPSALDDLKVNPDPVAHAKVGHRAHLAALEGFDQFGHCEKKTAYVGGVAGDSIGALMLAEAAEATCAI